MFKFCVVSALNALFSC